MKSRKNEALIQNLRRKGISFQRGDTKLVKSYNYYQIINAYKALFITSVKTIDDIKQEVLSNKNLATYARIFGIQNIDSLQNLFIYESIVRSISKRYFDNYKREPISNLEKTIEEKKYLLHIYDLNATVKDFVRMYQFEHGLRIILLKYVLRIEEELKHLFTSTLNDLEVDSNYLLDINSYNVKNNGSITSIIKVLKKNDNTHSNAINRKKEQSLIAPYWILINEMTMGELTHSIRSLNTEVQNNILDKILQRFTIQVTPNNKDRKAILNFLSDISAFRNNLAHNNPIYQYNIKDSSLADYPNFSYLRPKISNFNKLSTHEKAVAINKSKSQIKSDLVRFFGSDIYNQQPNSSFNINLSYIIYVLNKMITRVSPSTKFSLSLKHHFNTYGLITCVNSGTVDDYTIYANAVKNIDGNRKKLNQITTVKYKHLTDVKSLKEVISQMKQDISTHSKVIKENIKHLEIKENLVKYSPFRYLSAYTKYTGIDNDFLTNISCKKH